MEPEYTIEDCIEMVMGHKPDLGTFKPDPKDVTVLKSIATQVARGTALTDRQYTLVKEKLSDAHYMNQFVNKGMSPTEYQAALNELRSELREIDRSKYVTVVNEAPAPTPGFFNRKPEPPKSDVPWIKVGFPFAKRLIKSIDSVASKTDKSNYVHNQGSRDHYFKFDEKIVYELISEFKNKEFEIDNELLEFYKHLEDMKTNIEKYVPLVKPGELVNFSPTTEEFLVERFGYPNEDNIAKYKDRSLLYGINHFDKDLLSKGILKLSPLTDCIVNRTSAQVLVRPKEWDIDTVFASINEIDRLPLLVIMGTDNALEQIKSICNASKDFVKEEEISVLFRLDNDTNAKFNDYVKKERLNNPVTENTKIVVISKDKLPKPLIKSGWMPDSILRLGSTRLQTKIEQWIYNCDLVIHYDSVATQWASSYTAPRANSIRKIITI